MTIRSTYLNAYPMKLRGMAQTDTSSVVSALVDAPGFDVCACDQTCEFEENAFVKNGGAWWEKDKKRFIRSKVFASDTIVFSLLKDGVQVAVLNSSTYGDYYDFGSNLLINANYKCIILDWTLVQQAFGYGKYKVRTVHASLAVDRTYDSHTFHVREFVAEVANGTVRIETYQTGVLMNGFDYSGINLYQSLRIKGRFGDKKPEYSLEYYQDLNRKEKQIQASVRDVFTLETEILPASVYNVLNYDDILANDIYITDYNLDNQEEYFRKNVVFTNMPDAENHAMTKKADFVYEFKNKVDNIIKRNIDGDFGLMPLQPNNAATISCADATLTVNSDDFTSIPSGNTYDLIVKDDLGASVGSKIGNEWIVPSGIVPAGVLLRWPIGQQYTSYRTGDVGWRLQNGYFDYATPANPKAIAALDLTLGANYFWRLKSALVVGGVSSTIRFVDVDGGQTWSATDNKDKMVVDKLLGKGIYRTPDDFGGFKTWAAAVDYALGFSITIDGVLYDNWYLVSQEEIDLITGQTWALNGTNDLQDPVSLANIILFSTNYETWTSTTQANNTANAYPKGWNASPFQRGGIVKTNGAFAGAFLVCDVRSLITAP
jgi:hypothetical protein